MRPGHSQQGLGTPSGSRPEGRGPRLHRLGAVDGSGGGRSELCLRARAWASTGGRMRECTPGPFQDGDAVSPLAETHPAQRRRTALNPSPPQPVPVLASLPRHHLCVWSGSYRLDMSGLSAHLCVVLHSGGVSYCLTGGHAHPQAVSLGPESRRRPDSGRVAVTAAPELAQPSRGLSWVVFPDPDLAASPPAHMDGACAATGSSGTVLCSDRCFKINRPARGRSPPGGCDTVSLVRALR